MGGTNEMKVAGLRTHQSGGDVHIHDDGKGIKFQMKEAAFKTAIQDALNELSKGDGVIQIPGDAGSVLCVGKTDGIVFTILRDDKDTKAELETLIKGI